MTDPLVDKVVSGLLRTSVASVGEVTGRQRVMAHDIRPVAAGQRCAGPAVVCHCEEGDNLALHEAFRRVHPGAVIVVATEGRVGTGVWGGLLTRSALALGLAGTIADGGVRDTSEIRASGYPVWSRFVSPLGSAKQHPGPRQPGSVICGGVEIREGDYVLADDDGVVVVPLEDASEVVEEAQARDRREELIAVELDAGRLIAEVLGWPRAVEEGR